MQDHTTIAPQSETTVNEPHKLCTNPNCERAGQLLPLSEFHKNKNRKDGHVERCKDCILKAMKNRYNRPKTFVTKKQCYNPSCRRYGQVLPIDEFNKSTASPDGYFYICRECANERVRKQRERDPDNKEKTNVYARYFRKTLKGRINDRRGKKKYRQSPKGRLNDAERRKRDKQKMQARSALNHAVDTGKLPPPTACKCFVCGNAAKEYHHYLGYEPKHHLDVKPVCKMCHAAIHHAQASDTRS